MKLSRDSWLAIGLFVVLAILTVFAAIQQTQDEVPPPLVGSSTAPDGARALWLWLDELGYQLDDQALEVFRVPEEAEMMLMLEPVVGVTPGEWELIDKWVDDGGTLVLAGEGVAAAFAARHYGFTLAYLSAEATALAAQTPLFSSPPLTAPATVRSFAYFETERSDFAALLAVEGGPVAVSFEKGAGRVIVSATAYPFSNAGLKEPGNPALALNLISAARRSGAIWFDEWHHGLRSTRADLAGPSDWLLVAPAGRSLLFVAVVIFLALLFSGRRFGRPVPLAKDITRRAPLEYITAIANLNRRAGHRRAVLRQYHHSLKRALGHRYRLPPTLPDPEYAARLASYNPACDEKALLGLLARLSRRNVSENEMIQLAEEVADWTKDS
jgi:hypothetical protein